MRINLKDVQGLNELIIMKGFNKREFSQAVQLSQPAMTQILNGKRNPSPRTAKRICVVLEVEFDNIFKIVRDLKPIQHPDGVTCDPPISP